MSTPGGTEMVRATGALLFFFVKTKSHKQEPFPNSER